MAKPKAKKVDKVIRLQIEGGKATAAPPVGPALGVAKVNIGAFCKEFNDKTKDRMGEVLPVVITVYSDKSFSFEAKKPPMANLIKKELGIESGSAKPNREKVGVLSKEHVEKIAKIKMENLNSLGLEGAMAMVRGSARSMGVDVEN